MPNGRALPAQMLLDFALTELVLVLNPLPYPDTVRR